MTSSQAMQVSRFNCALPIEGLTDSLTSISMGQAVTQALQKVQPEVPKSR